MMHHRGKENTEIPMQAGEEDVLGAGGGMPDGDCPGTRAKDTMGVPDESSNLATGDYCATACWSIRRSSRSWTCCTGRQDRTGVGKFSVST